MLPKQLKYTSKIESAMAQSYRSNIQPQNGTGPYSLGQTIIINIPTANNLVLAPTESYLKFYVNFLNGGTADNHVVLDSCGAHGFIQRIRIFHGSNLLQDIDHYGLLAKMLFDLQVPTDGCYGRYNALIGTRSDLISNAPTFTAPATNSVADITASLATATKTSSLQVNSGEYGTLPTANTEYTNLISGSTSVTGARYYCLNLISLLGTLSPSQYIPLFAMTSAPLRLEIQLVSDSYNAFNSLTSVTPSIRNVEYIANFIKLSDNAMSMIYGSLGGAPLEFSVPDYSNYQYTYSTITANSPSQINFAIPAKYSSLKSLFVTIRQNTGALTFFPFSSISAGITSYYFRVGSNIVPTKAPDNFTEMFSEVLKAMGSMSDLNYHPSIEYKSYTLPSSTAITAANYTSTNSGSFYIGLDLENYVSANKDTIFAGYNSNTDDIFAVINLTPAANVTPRFDCFANFDSVLVFENSVCYRKF